MEIFCNVDIFTLNYPIELILYMKMQKELRKFCPKCKTHTVQAVSTYKKGKDRKGAQGARRHAEDKKGYGGQKFPELKRTAKTTKKVTLRYTCKTCQRKTVTGYSLPMNNRKSRCTLALHLQK